MIRSFGCEETQRLFETGKSKRFANILSVTVRKLQQLSSAATLGFYGHPGDRKAITAFASMTSGECASSGLSRASMAWQLLTITKGALKMLNGMRCTRRNITRGFSAAIGDVGSCFIESTACHASSY